MEKNSSLKSVTLLFLLFVFSAVNAQNVFKATVIDEQTKRPVPFAKVVLGSNNENFIANEFGEISLELDQQDIIKVDAPGYFEVQYFVSPTDSSNPEICLVHRIVAKQVSRSNVDARFLMKKVLDNSVRNDPTSTPHEYKTYNKFTLETNDINRTKSKLNNFLRTFSLGIHEFDQDHHLLVTESVSERKYKNDIKEKETIIASKVSGIDKPNLFTVTPKIQPFSLYDFYLGIASGHFRSPLTHGALHDYNFEISDTIKTTNDTVYVVNFSPHKTRFFRSVRGVLFINSKHYGIQYAIIEPAKKSDIKVRFVQKNRLLEEGRWFPEYSSTLFYPRNTGYNKVQFTASVSTVFYDLELNQYFPRNTFGEIVYDFSDELIDQDSSYWEEIRKVPFTDKDRNTYAFYDTIGTIKNFQNLLSLTEKLYLKQVPYKYLVFDLTKFININDYEGFRLGMGIHNSEKVSKRFTVGGYAAFGFSDGKGKYGVDGTIHMHKRSQTDLSISYRKDVAEAGAVYHVFDEWQYSSEWLRTLKVSKMDKIRETRLSFSTNPLNYFKFQTFFVNSVNQPVYSYDYKGLGLEEYHFTEMGFGVRYAFGEKYLRFANNKIPMGSNYPIFWFKYSHGFDDRWDGDFLYNRYDIKINYSLPINRFGSANMQIAMGHVDNEVPYFKMYNGKGNSEVGAVAHNGFETMGMNEFLSSTYAAFYFIHDFGKLHFLNLKNYTPQIEIAHNMGFGSKVDRTVHQDIEFKTFEKGYYETGLILSNFIMFKAYVIKVGLGLGVFYRYGPYALDTFSENTRLKLSLDFQL